MLIMFFFFNDTATTEIYTLSLHDALPISQRQARTVAKDFLPEEAWFRASCGRESKGERLYEWACIALPNSDRTQQTGRWLLMRRSIAEPEEDRKSTRLNSSHANISYAVFCLKKKKTVKRTFLDTSP